MQDLDVFPNTYMVWRVSREPTLIYAFYVHLVICHAPDSVTTRHYLFVCIPGPLEHVCAQYQLPRRFGRCEG